MVDFSKLQKVTKVNPLKKDKKQDYDLMYMVKAEKFRFSEALFEEIGLHDNSVIQYNVYDGNDKGVYLCIVPGNDGIFLKKQEKGAKGKEFKNGELYDALLTINGKPEEAIYFKLADAGEFNGFPLYLITLDVERHDRIVNKVEVVDTTTVLTTDEDDHSNDVMDMEAVSDMTMDEADSNESIG